MIFIALPFSVFGYYLAVLSTHSEGFFLFLGRVIVPGLFVEDYIPYGEGGLYWIGLVSIQIIYCSILIVAYRNYGKHNEKSVSEKNKS